MIFELGTDALSTEKTRPSLNPTTCIVSSPEMEELSDVYEESNASRKFQFIDCTDPHNAKTSKTKRLVHQQAMKEIGKLRRKPGRVPKAKPVPLDISALQTLTQEFAKEQTIKMLTKPSWWVGTSGIIDPFVQYPIELEPCDRELIALSMSTVMIATIPDH
jgi:hypothetical protein